MERLGQTHLVGVQEVDFASADGARRACEDPDLESARDVKVCKEGEERGAEGVDRVVVVGGARDDAAVQDDGECAF